MLRAGSLALAAFHAIRRPASGRGVRRVIGVSVGVHLPVVHRREQLRDGDVLRASVNAVAAARAGCKNIVLMERYGYMGGDVTGGYVIMVPRLSFYNKQYVRGLQEEWFTRMESIPGAVLGPSGDEIGCEDPVLVNAWKNIHDCFSTNAKLPERLVRSVYFEPNQLKIEMDKMLLEHKDSIHVMCHSWGTRPIMDGDTIKGVYFESKEGRKAVLALSLIHI